jgi:hypothetical protein
MGWRKLAQGRLAEVLLDGADRPRFELARAARGRGYRPRLGLALA